MSSDAAARQDDSRCPLLIRALGGLSIDRAGSRAEGAASQPRRLALVALIARSGERGITREKLLSLLWPDAEPEPARRALNQALYALRRDLDADNLVLGVHELRLNPEVATCDVLRFEADLRAGRLEAAVAHYAGPFLDGFRVPGAADFDRWADEERAELAHRYVGALERLARAADAGRASAEAVQWWRRLAAVDPLDARVALALMQALVADGDTAGALQHARIYEVLVAQELDLPADASVLELACRIRAGEVAPPARGARTVVAAASVLVPAADPAPAPGAAPGAATDAPEVADATRPGAPVPPAAPLVEHAIAVLPFVNLTGDAESDHLCDAVAEEIIHALAQVPEVQVLARSASFAFRGPAVDLGEVGARLGVPAVIEGSVRRCGSRVRVTARLVDVATRAPRWAERHDGDLSDVFAVQDGIAERVAERLAGESGGAGLTLAPGGAGRGGAPALHRAAPTTHAAPGTWGHVRPRGGALVISG
jgi:TolB-like protein/DNA-binding SARP family transcriptional activator